MHSLAEQDVYTCYLSYIIERLKVLKERDYPILMCPNLAGMRDRENQLKLMSASLYSKCTSVMELSI